MTQTLSLTVNGKPVTAEVEPRRLLVDFLRDTLGLTGTHVGCETSQCGACVVRMDGRTVKACTILALQAEGSAVITIEGLAHNRLDTDAETLHPMQAAFRDHHALQCGFCTPGMVMTAIDLVERAPMPSAAEIRAALDGNLCRCTGYQPIVKAIQAGAAAMRASAIRR